MLQRVKEILAVLLVAGVAAATSVVLAGQAQAATPTTAVVSIQGKTSVPSTVPGPSGTGSTFVLDHKPSEHCGYYHWVFNPGGIIEGDAYACLSNASINTYHAWVVCSEASGQIPSPTVFRGNLTGIRCDEHQGHASTGGFTRDS